VLLRKTYNISLCVYKTIVIPITVFRALFALSRQKNRLKLLQKAWRVLRHQGMLTLWQTFQQFNGLVLNYSRWVNHYDTIYFNDCKVISSHVSTMPWHPSISIIMPIHNASEKWLRKTIESVRSQFYPYWELCIAYDASTDKSIHSILEGYTQLDERIRVVYREQNINISVASNRALELAQGEFMALLDLDDELPRHALYMISVALNEKPYLDLIYSDEDKIDRNGRRFNPYFKPDWNPTLLNSQNMIKYLCVYRTELIRSVGKFREVFEGVQDWDLALRVTEQVPASHIHHIPHILYHKRVIEGSGTIDHDENSYTVSAATNMLQEHLKRTRRDGIISLTRGGHLRIRYTLASPAPLVSIIIPTRNGLNLVRRCIESIKTKTRYSGYEILIVDNQSDDPDTLNYMKSLESAGIARILEYNFQFNHSAINNFAVQAAKGDYLCLMNSDIEIISEDWLNEMVGNASRPEIGAVGAMLYFPNDTIQHAGIILGIGSSGVAGHIYADLPRGINGYNGRAASTQNLSAVTAACMVVRKALYIEVGGMDEKNLPVEFNDVDFCLKIEEHGYRNLWTPFAEFYHHENATRGYRDTIEKNEQHKLASDYMQSRWGYKIENDPCYNPNLTLKNAWPYPASIPRIKKPWKS
jgi:O-antigen biosynthesis protein